MEYADLKRLLGERTADRLENEILMALAEARSPQAREALTRLLSYLTAAVAHRVTSTPDIATRCMSDFSSAYELLRQDRQARAAK